MESIDLPKHILNAFGFVGITEDNINKISPASFLVADTVFTKVADTAIAVWSAMVRENMNLTELLVAKPLRSKTGRFISSGWKADSYISGKPAPNYEELIKISVKLDEFFINYPRPDFLLRKPQIINTELEVFEIANATAFHEKPQKFLSSFLINANLDAYKLKQLALVDVLSSLRKKISLPYQVVASDLVGNILFSDTNQPILTDIIPYFRPHYWSAAVVVVDAIAWGGAEINLIEKYLCFPEWEQLLLRAALFRVIVHILHPRASQKTFSGIVDMVDKLRLFL